MGGGPPPCGFGRLTGLRPNPHSHLTLALVLTLILTLTQVGFPGGEGGDSGLELELSGEALLLTVRRKESEAPTLLAQPDPNPYAQPDDASRKSGASLRILMSWF